MDSGQKKAPLRVVVVEDTPSYHDWLIDSLSRHPDQVSIVGEADNAQDALTILQQQECDVVLLDLHLQLRRLDGSPRAEHGLSVIQGLRAHSPRPRILVLSSLNQGENDVYSALKAGADACMYKDDLPSVEDLISNLHKIALGQTVFSSRIAQLMLADYLRGHSQRLSPSGKQVLEQLGQGKTQEEIDQDRGAPLGSASSTAADLLQGLQELNEPKPTELFCSYSHRDERLRERLETHLALLRRDGVVAAWHDRKIRAGAEWSGEIDSHLESAGIILLLISADFLASTYCYDVEMKRALERHKAGTARVIPVMLRPVEDAWKQSPFAHLQALPKDGKAVTRWADREEAWVSVTNGIRAAIKDLTVNVGKKPAPSRKRKPRVSASG